MPTAITGGPLITGLDKEPISRGTVLLEEEVIVAAGPADTTPIPREATVLDAGGATILPGIIDCHVHSTYRSRDIKQHLLNTPTYNVLKSVEILRETLACGVTTAREMGGADAGFRDAVHQGIVPGPRLLVSIVMISQTGGHADYWVPAGMRIPKRTWLPDPVADGPDAVRRLVRFVLMAGADFVKICATGGITSATDHWDEPQFSCDELTVAVAEAAAKRKTVAVHAEGREGIRNALEAGIHSLEHGWFIDEECVARMIERGVWWVPTLALVPLSIERRGKDTNWANMQLADEGSKDAEIYGKMQEQIPLWKDAVRRGVKVAFGTDQSHRLMVGENLAEMRFMVDWLGMSPMEVILSATSRAAECIGRADVGALAPGRKADILVVDGDPLSDITVLERRENLKLVMQGGKPFTNLLA